MKEISWLYRLVVVKSKFVNDNVGISGISVKEISWLYRLVVVKSASRLWQIMPERVVASNLVLLYFLPVGC